MGWISDVDFLCWKVENVDTRTFVAPSIDARESVKDTMDQLTIARALHVLAVVIWIGGVGFVTTVLLPAVRLLKTPAERVGFFDAVERRFAWQARATTLLAAATGFFMTSQLDLWSRFFSAAYWWMHAMVAVWLLFTIMLFVTEPLVLHGWFHQRAKSDPEGTFVLIERMHRILLVVSLITILGAVAGSHGGLQR
ncbi:MAG: hypothetical protein U1E25_16370 [Methylocystis sp.]